MAIKLDPRTKLVITLGITSLAIFYDNPVKLLILLLCAAGLLPVFGVDFKRLACSIKPYLFLLLILFVVQVVFTPGGDTLLAWGPLRLAGTRGLVLGSTVVLRLLIVIAAGILLTTSNSRDFISGLVQWKIPYEIAFMVSVTIRFLPVFKDECVNVVTAVQLRGVEFKRVEWGKKIDLFRCLFMPLVYGALIKAQELSIAMETRGFKAYPRRTYLRQLSLKTADYISMTAVLTMVLLLMGLEISLV